MAFESDYETPTSSKQKPSLHTADPGLEDDAEDETEEPVLENKDNDDAPTASHIVYKMKGPLSIKYYVCMYGRAMRPNNITNHRRPGQ